MIITFGSYDRARLMAAEDEVLMDDIIVGTFENQFGLMNLELANYLIYN